MNQRLTRFTKFLLDAMFCLGILVTAILPFFFRWAGNYITEFKVFYGPLTILYMLSGVFSLLIVLELRKMFRTVLADDAFVPSNAESLKKMAGCSFIIALLSLIRLFFMPTPATAIIIIVFSIAGLFSLVLCQVFEKAIRYKEENDLTI